MKRHSMHALVRLVRGRRSIFSGPDRVGTVVVGAGIVGLSCALALVRAERGILQNNPILVLEANAAAGLETTSRNSGVIHAGLYYPEGSLKSRLCTAGRSLLYAYAQERQIPHGQCGKLVVATNDPEREQLRKILVCARTAGLSESECRTISGAEARAMEPEVRCVEALFSTVTGWIDAPALVASLQADLEARGVDMAFNCRVTQTVSSSTGDIILETTLGTIACSRLVNACGLEATKFAYSHPLHGHQQPPKMSSGGDDSSSRLPKRVHFAKGTYFRLKNKKGSAPPPFSHHIYPVPTDGGLGVHATVGADGQIRFGPDVEWLRPPSSSSSSTMGGFAWPPGEAPCPSSIPHMYLADEARADLFRAAIRKYYPALQDDDITVDYAGIRTKLSGPGEPNADFDIRAAGPNCVHLLGIESPGLTSSLAIGEYVASLLIK